MEGALQELKKLGICVEENNLLARHCSFRIGGAARGMVFPKTAEEMRCTVGLLAEQKIPFRVCGRGSNLVFPDEGLCGVVVFTTGMRSVTWQGAELRAEAGASLSALALAARDRGLTGLEFAHGIPGTLGGAVFMNAGAFGQEMAEVCAESTYLDLSTGTVQILRGKEHGFSYRKSIYQEHPEWILLDATLVLTSGDRQAISARMEEQMARRRATQPWEFPSAGSVFKRPAGDAAGRLIDACGLKGLAVGGAMVSPKHAGFIVNTGNATCADVRALVGQIRERVLAQTGVLLECEIEFVEM
ncbi:MAG: UDP-N-acetylmuramate dehydrogenase [Clostridia bacterium]|nr:UDP-N-acetylmuramate dehydrogenase [Clostridia bacterium]